MSCGISSAPAYAQSCASATTQGTAPAGWQTYCWLDFTGYNDATARSASGQNFTFTLSDASVLSFNLKATSTAASAVNSRAAPSWTGAAVGNSAFLGIPGRPILYMANSGSTVNFNISSILITPPPGAPAVTAYAFVAADAESTDNSETMSFGTNGGNWIELDRVNPISGSQYPTSAGIGTTTFTTTGGGLSGNVGGYIVGTNSPTTVTASMTGAGLQGMMFAVRFASIRLTKQIVGARVNSADQFQFRIAATSSGSSLASGTTTGTGNGPFTAAAVSLASGIPLTVTETMASGSVSSLSKYDSRLTCTNGTSGSSTTLPTNVQTASYNFGSLQFGDAIQCTFTNTAYPHIRLLKALATARRFSTDQFTVRIMNGATVTASATTSGATNVVTGGDTGILQVNPGTAYTLDEIMSGPGNLGNYSYTMSCTNGTNGISASFPTTMPGVLTPVMGDVITCTITNSRLASNARLVITKSSSIISDGISGANPKALPGARVQYTIAVSNVGNQQVDSNTIILADIFPPDFTLDASTPMTMNLGNSGLNAFNQSAQVTYSSQSGGGAPFTASLGSGYNSALTGFRFLPSGTMAAATTSGATSFSLTYYGRVD